MLGPEQPLVNRLRNLFLQEILIKLERDKLNLAAAKQVLLQAREGLWEEKDFRKCQVVFDVDPG
ncbi:MAG: hypothetical protein HC923_04315 [Myxococcales bacterium]|nr:hypothetical protein [Myxococcales bacterium]